MQCIFSRPCTDAARIVSDPSRLFLSRRPRYTAGPAAAGDGAALFPPVRMPPMPRLLRLVFAGLIALVLVGGPLGYKWVYDQSFRNFRVVEEGVLYRSGQL